MNVAEILPDVPISGLAASYSYAVPHRIVVRRGSAVLIPFGNRTTVGFVISKREAPEDEFGFELKEISSAIEGIDLPENILRLLDFISETYLSPPGAGISAAMPPGIRTKLSTAYFLREGDASGLSPAQREVLKFIKEIGGKIAERTAWSKKLARTAVAALVKRGLLEKRVELASERKKTTRALALSSAERAEEFLHKDAGKHPAQSAVLAAMLDTPRATINAPELASLAGVTESSVSKLVEAGLLVEVAPKEAEKIEEAPRKLTSEQAAAASRVCQVIAKREHAKFLLHGVTGSGKTEVYLRAVAEALARGRQALYVVPEITLTAQVVGQLRSRFGSKVAVMHSALPDGERLRHWRRIRNGEAPVVIGARSAIFAPLDNLGLVVVDEEHDGSYKQDTAPRYHLRDLAEFRAREENSVLILGSATPAIETYSRAMDGEIELLKMTKRAAAASLPKVVVTDLREVFKQGAPSIIGPDLGNELRATLAAREQAILFINRRAYAHALVCRDCGHMPKCPNCSVSLTLHRKAAKLRCHHCGFQKAAPDRCPNCESLRLRPLGLGTEKVEEVLRKEFPDARVARIDRDVARRQGAVDEVFARFREGGLDILVGTQMVAKGLDFAKVTLVGVIAADTGLSIPDFRATERTFQLLTQVAGRAGRRKQGRVVIQSFQPEHPAITFAAAQDYEDFYRAEICERNEAHYPPFVRLVNVIATSKDLAAAVAAIRTLADYYSELDGLQIAGPTDCPIGRLHGSYRQHALLKLEPQFQVADLAVPEGLIVDKSVQILIDVNPLSLL